MRVSHVSFKCFPFKNFEVHFRDVVFRNHCGHKVNKKIKRILIQSKKGDRMLGLSDVPSSTIQLKFFAKYGTNISVKCFGKIRVCFKVSIVLSPASYTYFEYRNLKVSIYAKA